MGNDVVAPVIGLVGSPSVPALVPGLELVAGVALFLALAAVLVVVVSVNAMGQRLRQPLVLRPGDRVPIRWRWSPEPAAVLHRRLFAAVGLVRLACPGPPEPPNEGAGLLHPLRGWRQRQERREWRLNPPAWVGPVEELEDLAWDVDLRLCQAGVQPRPLRRQLVAEAAREVATVERLAGRLVTMLRAWDSSIRAGPSDQVGALPRAAATQRRGARLDERLDALEGALVEIDRCQRRSGAL